MNETLSAFTCCTFFSTASIGLPCHVRVFNIKHDKFVEFTKTNIKRALNYEKPQNRLTAATYANSELHTNVTLSQNVQRLQMAEYCSIYMHILIRIERAVACDKFTVITNTTIYVTCNHIHASLKDKHHTVQTCFTK